MITFIQKIALTLLTLILVTSLNSSFAAQISQAQIEQFKKLPASQQQALAKSMGVDINALKGQLSTKGGAEPSSIEMVTYPRGTQFDAQGNPTQEINEKEEHNFEGRKALKPFGYDVFANEPQTFAPTMDIAIPSDYMVAPGDKISIQIFGKETNELELEVNREGQVVFPQHGPFTVSGLSFTEMKHLLAAKIKEKIIGVDVVIGMASLRSMRVFVLGDAYKPGPYTLSSLSSITHAIFAAGGISDIGSLRNIQLKRAGKLIKTLDLYDLLIQGDSSNDVLLQSGDVVFIAPVGDTVSIEGEVRRPAIYELIKDDSFNDVVAMSGGLLPSAYAKSTIVERYNQNNLRSVINIDFTNSAELAIKSQAGDVIRVMKTANMFSESVTVIGAITRPGKYQWHQGQKITDLLPEVNSHTLANADLNYSIIIRELDVARNIEVLQFELAKAIANPESSDNITLQANDKVLVFSQVSKLSDTDLTLFSRQRLLLPIIKKLKRQGGSGQAIQLVEVDGSVKFPGVYPLAKNARVDDLILAAGGLDESAYLARAEITRNQVRNQLVNKLSLSVDLGEALQGSQEDNVLLHSKDRLHIHQIPAWSENHIVELRGEFVFPGKYTIRRGESLSELIAKAGGFTQFAHQEGSVFTRIKLQELEQQNLLKLIGDLRVEMASKSLSDEGYSQSYSEVQKMLGDLTKLQPLGRLVLDLPRVVKNNAYDVLLEDGDVLYVPTLKNSINVIGQVQVTSSHIYDASLTAEDYVTQSGGSKKRADEGRIYIISANGSIKMMTSSNWFASDADSKMKPGDTIVVPLDSEYMNNLTLWTSATTILYNTAVAVAAIRGI